MLPLPAGREASAGVGASCYERHRPERTLLYQLVEDYYPALKTHLAAQGTTLPGYVEREFEAYLKWARSGIRNELSSISTCVERVARRFRLHGTCLESAQGCRGRRR